MKSDSIDRRIAKHLILLGIIFCVFYWFLDATLDAFIFDKGTLVERFFILDAHDILVRMFVVIILVLFAAYAQYLTKKRYQAEISKQQNENLFHNLINALPVLISYVDRNQCYQFANQAYKEKFNLFSQEIKGQHIREVLGERAYQLIRPNIEKVLLGESINEDYLFPNKDGRTWYFNGRYLPDLDTQGQVKGFFVLVNDITDQKLIEEELRNVIRYLNAVLYSTKDAIFSISMNRIILSCNQAAKEMFECTEQEIVGNTTRQFYLSEKQYIDFGEKMQTVINQMGFYSIEFELKRKSGEIFSAEVTVSTFILDGQQSGLVAVIRDITERKQVEEENEKIQKQLLQAQKMEAIGELVGGIAHDFNNRLVSILGYADMALEQLKERKNKIDPLYQYLKKIHYSATKSASLTQKLLIFSRKKPMNMAKINVNGTIKSMLEILPSLIGEDISINSNLEQALWTIIGDNIIIEQMIMNLVINARDAMQDGGEIMIRTENVDIDETYCSTCSYARIGTFICLSVSDTGMGMDKMTINRIFEPFFTTKVAEGGSGLGLAVVYGIVKQHDGWINVGSQPEKEGDKLMQREVEVMLSSREGQDIREWGSVFKIYLPATSLELEEQLDKTIQVDKFKGKGERILVVEDDPGVCEYVKYVLLNNNYISFVASSAKEAFEVFKREKGNFDLLFSDVILPDRSALTLVEQLLANKPELKILLTSGYVDEKLQWTIIKEKGYQFLEKPYSLPNLLKAIGDALDK